MAKAFNNSDKNLLAYIIGIALGDGNLSNPNGRSTRLRVTCDNKYPLLIQKIVKSIQILLPNNKVSIIYRKDNCVDISSYSNYWESILGWQVGSGSKLQQNVSIPSWIFKCDEHKIACLKGLIETDGSVYTDRGYKTVMFVSSIPNLARDVLTLIESLGFSPRVYQVSNSSSHISKRYNIRLSRAVDKFLEIISPEKI